MEVTVFSGKVNLVFDGAALLLIFGRDATVDGYGHSITSFLAGRRLPAFLFIIRNINIWGEKMDLSDTSDLDLMNASRYRIKPYVYDVELGVTSHIIAKDGCTINLPGPVVIVFIEGQFSEMYICP